jgi:hypothetical protein
MSLQSPVSPIQRLLAFLADKIPNSFCLQVRPVRLTLETSTVALKDSEVSNQSLSETGSGPWFIPCCGRGRAPPQHSNTVRELSEELQCGLGKIVKG